MTWAILSAFAILIVLAIGWRVWDRWRRMAQLFAEGLDRAARRRRPF